MLKKFLVIVAVLMLTACAKRQVEATDVVIHPAWPDPINSYSFEWRVVKDGDDLLIGLSYTDSLEFRLFLEDVKRYIRDTDSMTCFYRHEIGDTRCTKKSR